MKDLQKKVAVVTGASQGIGRAISLALAKKGCRLALIARGKDKLQLVADEITSQGGKAEIYPSDMSDPEAVYQVMQQIESDAGSLDILVNNAGLGTFKPLHLTSKEELLQPLYLPYASALVAVHAVLPGMSERGSGHIVNLTSPAGYFPIPNMIPYTSSRYAIVGLSLSLHDELAPKGIGVSLLCPGHVDTGYFENNNADMDWYPKISKLFPTIQAEDVAKQVISAIRYNKKEVIFPFTLWFMTRFTQTFPDPTYFFLKRFGLWEASVQS
ncbi:MAG: SDR family NAD(P)-dependent oxidoreductase [Spirochaetota bacterium]